MNLETILTADGSHSIFSTQFNVSYHSINGAIQESQLVFIEAGLHAYAVHKPLEVNVLEIGFGTGLNALMTWREAERLKLKVNYTTVEKYPIDMEQASELNYPEQLNVSKSAFIDLHWAHTDDVHPLSMNGSDTYFFFKKLLLDFQELDFENAFDVIYFDAFAPENQPELWTEPMLRRMYKALKTGGILTTYCAKGQFKRDLKAVGFQVEALPGPIGKREMTRATKN
jgi:tRNA U34 5-methylaminomethyl-2-thiouridine-forming methyltransferase MnmC